MASPQRCQSSWWSTSATEAPNRFCSCDFAERTCLRLPFRDPASGKCSSTERIPTYPATSGGGEQAPPNGRRPPALGGRFTQPRGGFARELPGFQAPLPVPVAHRPGMVHPRLLAEAEHVLHRQDRQPCTRGEREPDERPWEVVVLDPGRREIRVNEREILVGGAREPACHR